MGLVTSLLAWLDRSRVEYVAVAFDHVVESFRNDLFDGYKTGEGIDAELLALFPLAEEAARALGLVTWPMVEFEADDALATAAHLHAGEVDEVVLVTPDKDLAQCVRGTRVVLWDRRKDVRRDEQGVVEKFGVPPASIPDWLALVGDAADGIPGLPGWGAKSAATMLAAFGRVEAIPADPADWGIKVRGAARLAETLAARRDDALLYRQLATLRTDVPLQETLADLAWTGVPRAPWQAFCEGLGLDRLVDRPQRWR